MNHTKVLEMYVVSEHDNDKPNWNENPSRAVFMFI